jgi:geranylgeranyl diphosphate synthase type I
MPDFAVAYAGFRTAVQSQLDAFIERYTDSVLRVSPELAPALTALSDLLSGGKRLRPACCYWGYLGAGGEDGDAILHAASALELLQACALIHDDVMDNSDTRRGLPAVHRRFEAMHRENGWQGSPVDFGRAAAILIGDLAMVWTDAMLLESGFDTAALARAKPVFDSMRTELMAGQFLDVLEQARGGGSVERALRVVRFKTTAYTIERPLHLGAALAGASESVTAAYTAFGVPLGEAFQLRDDVLGVFGDPAQTGKPAGDDVREGKRTILIAIAQERADAHERAVLDRLVGDPRLDEAGLTEVRETLRSTGALAEVEERIAVNRDRAIAVLEGGAIADVAVDALRNIALAATERTA